MALSDWQRQAYEAIISGKEVPAAPIHHKAALTTGRVVGFLAREIDNLMDKTPAAGLKNSFITGVLAELKGKESPQVGIQEGLTS